VTLIHDLQALLLRNATVYIGARSVAKGEPAVKSLSEATGNSKIFLLQMDLADLPTIKKAVEEFQRFVRLYASSEAPRINK
jgi:retinol dehydrogenase 12